MPCPKCGSDTRVYDTYHLEQEIKRRRKCWNAACGFHFTTLELIISTDLSSRLGSRNGDLLITRPGRREMSGPLNHDAE